MCVCKTIHKYKFTFLCPMKKARFVNKYVKRTIFSKLSDK